LYLIHSLIGGWFKEYPSLKAIQVYIWLKDRDIDISYPLVVKYTRVFRKKKTKVYHCLNFLPGEEAQVDWCFINHPHQGKLACFVLILSYSRYLFAHIFPRFSFEFFIEGHMMAFSDMGGISYGMRPIFHQIERRVGTHIFLCVLAYHLLVAIEKTLLDRGIHTSWWTIRQILKTHQICTIVLPTDRDKVLNIRKASKPEPEHIELYNLLGIPFEIIIPKKFWTTENANHSD
jgi:hypothetical protein